MIGKIRVPLGFAAASLVFYLAAPNGTSIALGLPVALMGFAFRFLAAGVIRKDSQLATAGPYAWTRNPLYFGSFLLAAGFAIMSASAVAAALLIVPSAVIYPVVIRNEEAHLERLFPEEFRRYRASAPRFVPRFPARIVPSFSFAQYLANREYNTALGFVVALVVFAGKWWWR
jgi:protein-S-isoprenylcysteine O-methyltransferase Ste14